METEFCSVHRVCGHEDHSFGATQPMRRVGCPSSHMGYARSFELSFTHPFMLRASKATSDEGGKGRVKIVRNGILRMPFSFPPYSISSPIGGNHNKISHSSSFPPRVAGDPDLGTEHIWVSFLHPPVLRGRKFRWPQISFSPASPQTRTRSH